MATTVSPLEIKQFIIETLELEDLAAEEITDDQPLFGDGLGLDSIDALEIGVALRKRFGVRIDADDPDVKRHFLNVAHLVAFVNGQAGR